MSGGSYSRPEEGESKVLRWETTGRTFNQWQEEYAMATEKECRGIWHAGWVQDSSFTKLFSKIILRHRQILDPGLQRVYPKHVWAAEDWELKAPYARGKRNPSVKHKLREKNAGEQFLCFPELHFTASSQLSKGTAFMELESSATSVHFYIVYSQQTMRFSLACGFKNITEIPYGYRLGHLLFPLSQNYLL